MPIITIKVSDEDYDDLVNHIGKDSPGKLLVGVIKLIDARADNGGSIDAPKA